MNVDDVRRNELEMRRILTRECHACGRVRLCLHYAFLEREAPIPGTGWGCIRCHAPQNGALALVCDGCARAGRAPVRCFKGSPPMGETVDVSSLSAVPFRHNPKYHPEMLAPNADGGPGFVII